MSHESSAISQPERWLALARADLAVAAAVDRSDALQRGLGCFHCQQAAEKALKSVLVGAHVAFPWTHNLSAVLRLVSAALESELPDDIRNARVLSDYSSAARYPDDLGEVSVDDLDEAIAIATTVVDWAGTVSM